MAYLGLLASLFIIYHSFGPHCQGGFCLNLYKALKLLPPGQIWLVCRQPVLGCAKPSAHGSASWCLVFPALSLLLLPLPIRTSQMWHNLSQILLCASLTCGCYIMASIAANGNLRWKWTWPLAEAPLWSLLPACGLHILFFSPVYFSSQLLGLRVHFWPSFFIIPKSNWSQNPGIRFHFLCISLPLCTLNSIES